MATQPYILSFDEAKRDTRARRPSSAAPESRPVIHSVDAIPAFESPFRQAGEGRGSARTAAHARPSGAARRSSAGAGDGSFARISTFDRPAGRHAAPRPASSSSRRASSSYGTGRFSSFDERIEEQPEEEVEERRLTRKEQRKKARAKSKAERAFTKQFGGSKPSDASQSGPRAAVYKGEMGAKHRQAARMQNAESPQASAKRGFSLGSLASLKSSPKFIASAAVAVCLVLSCAFLYPPAQQYYHALRERDQLAAEYAALEERNGALESDVSSLQTDAGIEDRAHEQFGWVKKGEETANVRGLDLDDDEASTFRANITPGSVEAPETWYSPFLDALFGVE